MTMGKTTTYVDKEVLIAWRDTLTEMIEKYVPYKFGDWKNRWENDKKDYKYKKDEWEEILKGNDYY